MAEARRGVQVIVAVGEGKAALAGGEDLLGGVFLVLGDADAEEIGAAETFGELDVESGEVLVLLRVSMARSSG